MQVRLRYFALLREKIGVGETRDLPVGTTVATVWKGVVRAHPDVAKVQVRFAVNEEYVEPSHRLRDGDELAFFPPVSGG